jgi:hypothetical protein
MSENTKQNWQPWMLGTLLAAFMALAGFQLTNFYSQGDLHAATDNNQNERIAVLEADMKNMKEILVRIEDQNIRIEQKLDRLLLLKR